MTYTRDTEKEKQVTEWIQNYAKSAAGITLVEDADVVDASDKVVVDAINSVNLNMTKPNSPEAKQAQIKMYANVANVLGPKKKAASNGEE